MKRLSLCVALASMVGVCWADALPAVSIYSHYQMQAEQIYQKMTPEERIGQLIAPGYQLLYNQESSEDTQKCAQAIQVDPDYRQESTIKACGLDQIAQYHLGALLIGGGTYLNAPTVQNWIALNAAAKRIHDQASPYDPVLLTGNDLIHGNQHVEGAVMFPQNIGLGVTHDPALIRKMAYLDGQDSLITGFNWAYIPTVAIAQDFRWGRTYESFGQNPALVKNMAQQFIAGLQAVHSVKGEPKLTGPVATVKHFIGDGATQYGLDEGDDHYSGNEQAFWDKNGPGYEGAVDAQVGSLMVSYSAINGDKTRMHLGGEWNLLNQFKSPGVTGSDNQNYQLNGFVVSDWNAATRAAELYDKTLPSGEGLSLPEIMAKSINGGVDMQMIGPWDPQFKTVGQVFDAIQTAVNDHMVSQARLKDAVVRILEVKLAMAAQQPSVDQYARVQVQERKVALQAAEESLVLLKNDNHTLPIHSHHIENVIFVGDADDVGIQNGGWTITWQGQEGNQYFSGPEATTSGAVSIEQAVRNRLGSSVNYYDNPTDVPVGLTAENTVVVSVLNEPPYAEFMGDIGNSQEADALYNSGIQSGLNAYMPAVQSQTLALNFTPEQAQLITQLRNKDISNVTVVYSGRPIILPLGQSDAVIAAFLPGTLGGQAVANAIFGVYHFKHFKHFGRFKGYSNTLTFPWPENMEQVTDHFAHGALFPVGYGLSDR